VVGVSGEGRGFPFIAEHRLMVDMVRVVRTHRGRTWLDGRAVLLCRASIAGFSAAGIKEKGGLVCLK
jgi:hypothetical protein